MASAMESAPIAWQFRAGYDHFDRPTIGRPTVMRASSTDVTGPGPASAAWTGLPTIWQNRPQHQQRRSVDEADQRASPPRDDSLTLSRTYRMRDHSTSGEPTAVGAGLPLRVTPVATLLAPGAVGQSPTSLSSPTHTGSPARSNSPLDAAMSHLGTAALLNGSAPDVELERPNPYSSRSFQNTGLNTINVGGVHDFIPATQRRSEHPRQGHPRLGHARSTSSNTFDAGFPMVNRGSLSGSGLMGTAFLHSSHDPADTTSQLPRQDNRREEPNAAHGRPFSGTTPPLAGGPDMNGLNTDFRSFGFGDPLSQDYRSVLPTSQAGPWPHQRGLMTPVRGEPHLSGSRVAVAQYATPVLTHQAVNMNPNAFIPGKNGPHTNVNGVYTPSYTPPTAPGSRRSNSGSRTSPLASSQGVEPYFAPLGPESSFFGIPPGTSPPRLGSDLHGQPLMSYGPLHSGPPVPLMPRYNAAHQHAAANAVPIQPEKDQNLSPLLRDFRANHKTKRFELKDAYRHIVEFSGDQHGSRFIQAKLETASGDEKERVFEEIQENALQLMTDIFGNYVIQKLFEHGTQAQKRILAGQMKGRIHYLTTQVYGCRVVQKALEHVLTDQQASIMKELEGNVLSIVENQNGNHVIQKAIERVPGEHIQFVFEAHHGHIIRLSKHNYGCRVVQRMLEHGPSPVKQWILGELRGAIPNLIEDQFGNYVIQHIIRRGDVADRRLIVTIIQQQLLHFSKHKFASNVVEAAIEGAEDGQRQAILRALTTGFDAHGQSQIYGLIRDQYGNYVIQKVLTRLDGVALNDLVLEIQRHLVTLRKVSHGKQVSAMEKALAGAIASLGRHYTGQVSPLVHHETGPSHRMPYHGPFPPTQGQHPRTLRQQHIAHM